MISDPDGESQYVIALKSIILDNQEMNVNVNIRINDDIERKK